MDPRDAIRWLNRQLQADKHNVYVFQPERFQQLNKHTGDAFTTMLTLAGVIRQVVLLAEYVRLHVLIRPNLQVRLLHRDQHSVLLPT